MKRKLLGYEDIDDQIADRTYFPINYPLIRLEDVMLMYAEIVGPTGKGKEMVNKIRTRAGLVLWMMILPSRICRLCRY